MVSLMMETMRLLFMLMLFLPRLRLLLLLLLLLWLLLLLLLSSLAVSHSFFSFYPVEIVNRGEPLLAANPTQFRNCGVH